MRTYKSQIRHSVINGLMDKVRAKNYGAYLIKMNLTNIRGLKGQTISFDFPVTALIGPNGGGKTTILGAAATAYASIKPRQFFSKSGRLDESMTNWKVEYELIERTLNRNDTVRRTAAFHNSKWSRTAVNRQTVVLGVSRTVPASERKELQKFASGTFTFAPESIESIQQPVADAVQKILGKDIAQYTQIRIDQQGRVSLLTGATDDGTRYSEFHFGAGESSIIRMVMQVEASNTNALILIEEIENGLHPVATVRVVEYLIDAAERKSIQAIFTTHSNDALLPLPPEAIWASVNGTLFQGKLDITSLRAITGQIDASLAIFCEDDFATSWIQAIIRSQLDIDAASIEVYAMAGDGTATSINRHHNLDPAVSFPSICIIDGDSRQTTSTQDHVYRLPGHMPEAYIFDQSMEAEDHKSRLTVRLNQRFEDTDKTMHILREVRATNRDAHVLFDQIAQRLGFLPVEVVREAFFATWVDTYPGELQEIIGVIRSFLPDPRVRWAGSSPPS